MIQNENRRRILLEAGTEGGSVGIAEYRSPGNTLFVYFVDECTVDFLSDGDREGLPDATPRETVCDSFPEALRLLERYRWWRFVPLEVAPDFRDAINEEVMRIGDDRSNQRWRAYLDQSDAA